MMPLEIAFFILTKALLGKEGVGAKREQRTLGDKVQGGPVHGGPAHGRSIVQHHGERPQTVTSVLDGPVGVPTLSSPLPPTLEAVAPSSTQAEPASAEPAEKPVRLRPQDLGCDAREAVTTAPRPAPETASGSATGGAGDVFPSASTQKEVARPAAEGRTKRPATISWASFPKPKNKY